MIDFNTQARALADGFERMEETSFSGEFALPDRKEITNIIKEMRKLFFPAYFSPKNKETAFIATKNQLWELYGKLKTQIEVAVSFKCKADACHMAEDITDYFFNSLPEVQRILQTDLVAAFEGDPAAKNREEIIFCYPGYFAIFVYRLAHVLYKKGVPYIPRMMTEYAHGKTGIDIHPGACIDEYFFIDHGTGIVIGETAVIGKGVKLYQGVTLGALSPRQGQRLAGVKRHPTLEDNVTIYAGASIFGGETVIGEGAVVGGGAFVLESVPRGAKVSAKLPELIIK